MVKRDEQRLTMPAWPNAGRALGLGRNAIYEGIARGDIPSVRIGKRILVPVAALHRMLECNGAGGVDEVTKAKAARGRPRTVA